MIQHVLERSETVKDLGIYFDQHLTFNEHINQIISSAYRTYGFIIRNCKSFDVLTLQTLYFSLVRYKLEYGSLIWSLIYKQYIDVVDKLQKKFLKFLCFKIDGIYPTRGTEYNILLHKFGIQSLEQRRNKET
ncbi:unnamed protein product [Acanthoscelides obtectus]|uniref:Uncharacterized protein n=1 Tax=Acanthoscelides obtectus TaxID=200917 RepID=A0A9P0PFD8_ACAOB|nr:unnamed protein product [Acanthoscelides obtectus]CAK1676172.1 hypothetical protein AOBTE_LOCUS30630 [Acanthoscelides obtectus]